MGWGQSRDLEMWLLQQHLRQMREPLDTWKELAWREPPKDRGLSRPVHGTGLTADERGGSVSSEVKQFPDGESLVTCMSEM